MITELHKEANEVLKAQPKLVVLFLLKKLKKI